MLYVILKISLVFVLFSLQACEKGTMGPRAKNAQDSTTVLSQTIKIKGAKQLKRWNRAFQNSICAFTPPSVNSAGSVHILETAEVLGKSDSRLLSWDTSNRITDNLYFNSETPLMAVSNTYKGQTFGLVQREKFKEWHSFLEVTSLGQKNSGFTSVSLDARHHFEPEPVYDISGAVVARKTEDSLTYRVIDSFSCSSSFPQIQQRTNGSSEVLLTADGSLKLIRLNQNGAVISKTLLVPEVVNGTILVTKDAILSTAKDGTSLVAFQVGSKEIAAFFAYHDLGKASTPALDDSLFVASVNAQGIVAKFFLIQANGKGLGPASGLDVSGNSFAVSSGRWGNGLHVPFVASANVKLSNKKLTIVDAKSVYLTPQSATISSLKILANGLILIGGSQGYSQAQFGGSLLRYGKGYVAVLNNHFRLESLLELGTKRHSQVTSVQLAENGNVFASLQDNQSLTHVSDVERNDESALYSIVLN
jgi:hypothetical protein